MKTWDKDIVNEYLEENTLEKVYIIAGTKVGDREGHILIVAKELYGHRSSGIIWHERFDDCLRDIVLFM